MQTSRLVEPTDDLSEDCPRSFLSSFEGLSAKYPALNTFCLHQSKCTTGSRANAQPSGWRLCRMLGSLREPRYFQVKPRKMLQKTSSSDASQSERAYRTKSACKWLNTLEIARCPNGVAFNEILLLIPSTRSLRWRRCFRDHLRL